MKEVNNMKAQEYLVTLLNKESLETMDTFYINAYNLPDAKVIASNIMHDYDNVNYFDILPIVESA